MEHDLTRGNVLKTIAVFALPYMLSYFLQMLYGMADLYMMGQFSGAAGISGSFAAGEQPLQADVLQGVFVSDDADRG